MARTCKRQGSEYISPRSSKPGLVSIVIFSQHERYVRCILETPNVRPCFHFHLFESGSCCTNDDKKLSHSVGKSKSSWQVILAVGHLRTAWPV